MTALDFEAILGKPFDAFVAQNLGKTFHHHQGSLGRFNYLLDWRAINELILYHQVGPPRLRMSQDGGTTAPRSLAPRSRTSTGGSVRRLQTDEIVKRMCAGATMIIDAVQELREPIADLAADFERAFQDPVGVNAYVSWKPVEGFGLHWDEHDVFVLQLTGKKRWSVYGSTMRYPISRFVDVAERPTGDPLWEGFLSDGDVLYLPRGCWHLAVADDGPSLHLSIGVRRRTAMHFMDWLMPQLRVAEDFRKDLPRFDAEGDLRERAESLRATLARELTEERLAAYLRHADAGAPRRPALNLPWSVSGDITALGSDLEVALTVPRPVVSEEGESFAISVDEKTWHFHTLAARLVMPLRDRSRSIGELKVLAEDALSAEQVNALIVKLAAEGLISITESVSAT